MGMTWTSRLSRRRVPTPSRPASGRVRYFAGDAAATDRDGAYDLVTAFECIHDLANPVDVLATMRRLVKPDGHVIVMDERVAERFPGRG